MGLQKIITRAATRAGFVVTQCLEGRDALRIATDEQPDLVLLDVMMPYSDGRDVLRDLKAGPQTKDIPVFVYTARDAHYDRLAALELGADDYFEKPFDLELLMTRIEYRIWKRQHGE